MLRRSRPTFLVALLSGAALALTGMLAYLVPVFHQGDVTTLRGFATLDRPRTTTFVSSVAHLADPTPYALLGSALLLVALVRRRWRIAAAVPLVLFLTGFTTEQLKHLLATPRLDEWLGHNQIAAASWPSGHATASMTLALLLVLVVPSRLRPTAAVVGGVFALAVSYAILALRWHFPSDVLGGYLVAWTYMLTTLGVLAAAEGRWPERRPDAVTTARDTMPALALASAGAAVVGAGVLARPHAVAHFAAGHTTFVVAALGLGGLALTLATLMAAGLRGPSPRRPGPGPARPAV